MKTIKQENIEVTLNDQLSVNDLLQRQAEGYSVVRSAHVGNAAAYNLVLAEAGIDMLLVDHTIPGKDRNYFPERVLQKSGNTIIAPLGRLTCLTQVEKDFTTGGVCIAAGTSLDQAHIAGLRAAIPGAKIETTTAYLRRNENIARELITVAMREMPSLFGRYVRADGVVVQDDCASHLVSKLGIMQLNDEPLEGGVLVPNDLDIAISFVTEALRTEQETQYHLSGADMAVYFAGKDDKARRNVNELIGLAQTETVLGKLLPPKLDVHLVPTVAARFATTTQRAASLESLLSACIDDEEIRTTIQDESRVFFGHNPDYAIRAEFAVSKKARLGVSSAIVAEKSLDLPELFTEPRQMGNISQYDLLAEGGLYTPAITRELSMTELNRLFTSILAARKAFFR